LDEDPVVGVIDQQNVAVRAAAAVHEKTINTLRKELEERNVLVCELYNDGGNLVAKLKEKSELLVQRERDIEELQQALEAAKMRIEGRDPRGHVEGLGPNVQREAIPIGDPTEPIIPVQPQVQATAITSEM